MRISGCDTGGARRHGAPFVPIGRHGGGSVVASHGKQSGDRQWRVEQSSGASEFEAGEMALLFVEVVTG
jgi:hypothetical protein